jgi:GTPase Era involved in 16S rRNA processing
MIQPPYRILVAGEQGVGKSAFINALINAVSPESNQMNYISSISSDHLPPITMSDEIRRKKFSESFITFLLIPHGKRKIEIISTKQVFESRIEPGQIFRDILIDEYPHITSSPSEYDKIIIMSEYSDITTMRSMAYWCNKLCANPKKTIVCVNKCDVHEECVKEDFRLRKAKVMDHFLSQCPVEYISAVTSANLCFIYKYVEEMHAATN